MIQFSRRCFLAGSAVVVWSCDKAPPSASPTDAEATTWLDTEQLRTLEAALDALIPGSGGAKDAGAARYVDGLLGAFETDPPRIYAGGPYSGRHGGPNGFCAFQELTRVEKIRWRTYIEGSQGIPEREFAGPVVGLQERIPGILVALDEAASDRAGATFADLEQDDRRAILLEADSESVQLLYELAVEGTYGDPVYGGNENGVGWAAIGFEGDRQPKGYTARQMAAPEEG